MPTQPAKQATIRTGPSFLRQVLIVVAVVIAAFGVIAALWFTMQTWLLVFAGVLLALFLRGVSDPISRWTRLPPVWSVSVVVLLLLGFAGLGVWVVLPSLSSQFTQLATGGHSPFPHSNTAARLFGSQPRGFYIENVLGDPPKADSIGE